MKTRYRPLARLLVPALAVVASLAWSGNAWACACCADKATWYETTSPLQSFERDELARLKVSPTAFDVPTNEGRNGKYTVSASFTGATWKIGLSGLPALTFAVPRKATTFVTDLYDGSVYGAGGPALYKELRLTGPASGPGKHFLLVLQGRGNNCLNGGDFTHWRLEITGGKEPLRVYGSFKDIGR